MRSLIVFNYHFEVRCDGYNHAPTSLKVAGETEELAKAALKQHLTAAHPEMVEVRFIGGPTLVVGDVLLAPPDALVDEKLASGEITPVDVTPEELSITPGTPTPVPVASTDVDEPPSE
jgi:hypothetical protein